MLMCVFIYCTSHDFRTSPDILRWGKCWMLPWSSKILQIPCATFLGGVWEAKHLLKRYLEDSGYSRRHTWYRMYYLADNLSVLACYVTFWTTSKWLVGVWERSPGIVISNYADSFGASQTHQGWTDYVLLFFLILVRDTFSLAIMEVENDYFGD